MDADQLTADYEQRISGVATTTESVFEKINSQV